MLHLTHQRRTHERTQRYAIHTHTYTHTIRGLRGCICVTGFWNSLKPCLIFCDLSAAGQWRETIKSMKPVVESVCLRVTARIYNRGTCDHQTPRGYEYIRLDWALLLTLSPFSQTLSLAPSLRNLQVTVRSLLVSTISHISLLFFSPPIHFCSYIASLNLPPSSPHLH